MEELRKICKDVNLVKQIEILTNAQKRFQRKKIKSPEIDENHYTNCCRICNSLTCRFQLSLKDLVKGDNDDQKNKF